MSRIRSVHPGLWTDESFVGLSPLARLICIGVWTECDDNGVFEWKPLVLKMRILPADNTDAVPLLNELIEANVVSRFSIDGKDYGLVRNFCRYQRPKKPKYRFPMPDEFRTYVGLSKDSSEPNTTSSPPVPHQFPTSGENPPQMEDEGGKREKERKSSSLRSEHAREPEDDWPSDFQERFWEAYPNKVGKHDAIAKLLKVRKSGVPWETVNGGLQRYIASKPPDRAWCNPATWLGQGRWEDQPAEVSNGTKRSGSQSTGEGAVLAGLARAFGVRDSGPSGPADEEIPRGRHELDLEPTRRR